jgi:hypothetical protein
MYDEAKLDIPDDRGLESYAPQSTYDLMNWLRNNYNGMEFYIVIGSDNADNINTWHDYEFLLKQNKFIIVNREMKCRYTPNNKYFSSNNVIKIINDFGKRGVYKSSTEIRVMIKSGDFSEAKKYCPKKVAEYIREHELYMDAETKCIEDKEKYNYGSSRENSNKKLKIGIDYHNTITAYHEIFSMLSNLLMDNGHEVHIVTGSPITDELKKELKEYNIKYYTIHSITDDLISNGITYNEDNKGDKHFRVDLWNENKARYCYNNNIDLMIDDSGEYGKYFDLLKTIYLQIYNKRNR